MTRSLAYALSVAIALSAAPAAAAVTPSNASSAQAAQYVQVQYRNEVMNSVAPSIDSNLYVSTPAATAAPSNYMDPMLQRPGFSWLETTSVVQLRYDPSFFDVPAGYTLVTPAPTDTPAPEASQTPDDLATAAPSAQPSPGASPAGAPD